MKHLAWVLLGLALSSCSAPFGLTEPRAPTPPKTLAETPHNLFIIGQDLGAIRDYTGSECCVPADGATIYLMLYDLLSEERNFGGLGIAADGVPFEKEFVSRSGPVNAYVGATQFGLPDLAIGLSMTENEHPGALDELVNGTYDDEIRQLAKLFKHVEGTVYLRIAYEFDGVWNVGYDNAERYKTAFRRVVDVLRAEDADNFVTVWQTSAAPVDDVIEKKYDNIEDWYPGDAYVDWVGLSWFISPDIEQPIESSYEAPTARVLLDEIVGFARARNKPVMIAEAAPQAYDLTAMTKSLHAPIWDGPSASEPRSMTPDEVWQSWFAPLFTYMHENDDVIDALAYINVNWDVQPMWGPPHKDGYWGDTRINQNDEIARRWNEAITEWRGH